MATDTEIIDFMSNIKDGLISIQYTHITDTYLVSTDYCFGCGDSLRQAMRLLIKDHQLFLKETAQ